MKHFEKIRISPIIITNFEQCFGTSWSGWIAYGLASKRNLSGLTTWSGCLRLKSVKKKKEREKGVSSRILWQAWLIRMIFNPLNPKIKIWILICCPYSFPTEVVGRSW